MPASLQIQIFEPCHENWNNMSPHERGRFCGSCKKTVVDFSAMTDKEVLEYISKASTSICGRLAGEQLNRDIKITDNTKRFSFTYVWKVLLATLLVSEANAQVKAVKKKKPLIQKVNQAMVKPRIDWLTREVGMFPVEVSGAIVDAFTKQPLYGASIRIKETSQGTAADTSGMFVLSIKNKETVTIEFSAIGYEPQSVIVNNSSARRGMVIQLKPQATALDPVVVKAFPAKDLYGFMGGISVVYVETIVEKVKKRINDWTPPVLKKDVKIYPNPVVRGNEINVSLSLKQEGEYKMELLNTAGQVIMIRPLIMQTKEQKVTLPTQGGWSSGIYYLRISSPLTKSVYQAKVLLQ